MVQATGVQWFTVCFYFDVEGEDMTLEHPTRAAALAEMEELARRWRDEGYPTVRREHSIQAGTRLPLRKVWLLCWCPDRGLVWDG